MPQTCRNVQHHCFSRDVLCIASITEESWEASFVPSRRGGEPCSKCMAAAAPCSRNEVCVCKEPPPAAVEWRHPALGRTWTLQLAQSVSPPPVSQEARGQLEIIPQGQHGLFPWSASSTKASGLWTLVLNCQNKEAYLSSEWLRFT